MWWALQARIWNIVCGSDIPLGATLGGGLMLPHPAGVVFHPEVHVGVNCMIFQQVTLGSGGMKPGVPTIGGHVDIGAGAKILGGVIVGHHPQDRGQRGGAVRCAGGGDGGGCAGANHPA